MRPLFLGFTVTLAGGTQAAAGTGQGQDRCGKFYPLPSESLRRPGPEPSPQPAFVLSSAQEAVPPGRSGVGAGLLLPRAAPRPGQGNALGLRPRRARPLRDSPRVRPVPGDLAGETEAGSQGWWM